MNLSEKQIATFFDTLIKIIEDREKVKIDYVLKKKKNPRKNRESKNVN